MFGGGRNTCTKQRHPYRVDAVVEQFTRPGDHFRAHCSPIHEYAISEAEGPVLTTRDHTAHLPPTRPELQLRRREMSMVLTRSPLEVIGMNGGGAQKRRSARLSHEGEAENEPPAKRSKANGVSTTTINTKQQDGNTAKAPAKKGRKGMINPGPHENCQLTRALVYDQDDEGFSFTKGKRGMG